jgi:hypothetical protein
MSYFVVDFMGMKKEFFVHGLQTTVHPPLASQSHLGGFLCIYLPEMEARKNVEVASLATV